MTSAEASPVDLNGVKSAHLIGIAGAGMTPLATILLQQGTRVTGSDLVDAAHLGPLRALGADIWIGHDASRIGSPDVVITTAAAHADNPEVAAAESQGIPLIKHAAALASLMHARRGIAVAGTHGKSTTTGMVAHVLEVAGLQPTFHVGAEVMNYGLFGRLGVGEHLVAEADEFDRRFLAYDPEVAVVTYAEPDHLDYFGTYEAMLGAYADFLARVRPGGCSVINVDDDGARGLPCPTRRITYGRSEDADWRTLSWTPSGRDSAELIVRGPDGREQRGRLIVLGRHNAANATATMAVAAQIGIAPETAAEALESFQGVSRRLERRGAPGEVTVIDDYAHHPTEVRASLAAIREHWDAEAAGAEIWAVYQPHTEHRTASLFDEFTRCFAAADHVLLAPAYIPTGRVLATGGATAAQLAQAMDHPDARAVEAEQAAELVAAEAKPGDVVVVMGAGDIWTIETGILDRLAARFGVSQTASSAANLSAARERH